MMRQIPDFETLQKNQIAKTAKELAWDDLSESSKERYIALAEVFVEQKLTALAIKCVKAAEEGMSAPDYISVREPIVPTCGCGCTSRPPHESEATKNMPYYSDYDEKHKHFKW